MNHKIIHADVIDGLRSLPDQCIQSVITLVTVFREVRRVLRDDGTVWLNLGDSYVGGSKKSTQGPKQRTNHGGDWTQNDRLATLKSTVNGLKPKDLIGIPWRVAFALQADGWYLRSDIIWNKPNAMPESVTDRPTSSYDHIFLLTKRARYYYDHEAVRGPQTGNAHSRGNGITPKTVNKSGRDGNIRANESFHSSISHHTEIPGGRNLRNVWIIPTQPTSDLHFATFPQALVEPCIKAGTSERGCCPECGAPWHRVIEKGESLAAPAIPERPYPAQFWIRS